MKTKVEVLRVETGKFGDFVVLKNSKTGNETNQYPHKDVVDFLKHMPLPRVFDAEIEKNAKGFWTIIEIRDQQDKDVAAKAPQTKKADSNATGNKGQPEAATNMNLKHYEELDLTMRSMELAERMAAPGATMGEISSLAKNIIKEVESILAYHKFGL